MSATEARSGAQQRRLVYWRRPQAEVRDLARLVGTTSTEEGTAMHSSLYGKIAKAKKYAQEPDRIQFQTFEATFRGENDSHTVALREGTWHCTCRFFTDWGTCCHTMATERVLGRLIPAEQRQGEPLTANYIPSLTH